MDHKVEQHDEIEALDSIYCGELESKSYLSYLSYHFYNL